MCRSYASLPLEKVRPTDLQRREPAKYHPMFTFSFWDSPKCPTPQSFSVRAMACWTALYFYFQYACAQLPLRQKKPALNLNVVKQVSEIFLEMMHDTHHDTPALCHYTRSQLRSCSTTTHRPQGRLYRGRQRRN